MDPQNDISNWISSIPKITRYWFFAFFAIPLSTRLGLINPMYLVLLPEPLFFQFQIWRPITCLLWYPVDPMHAFQWLILLFFLYSYSNRLETGYFSGQPADYLFMLIFNSICLVIISLFLGLMVLSPSLIFSVLYVWCQINRDGIVTFWFGIQVKAMYFPWVLFLFFFILGQNWMGMLLGIVVGHLYFFITMKYPQEFGGRQLIQTPQFMYKWLPNETHRMAGFGTAPASRRQNEGRGRGGHDWGQGQRLGD